VALLLEDSRPNGRPYQKPTAAREMGIDMDVISKNLGHASVAITSDIYAHLTPEVMEEAALKIESRLFGE
jgi:integrase